MRQNFDALILIYYLSILAIESIGIDGFISDTRTAILLVTRHHRPLPSRAMRVSSSGIRSLVGVVRLESNDMDYARHHKLQCILKFNVEG